MFKNTGYILSLRKTNVLVYVLGRNAALKPVFPPYLQGYLYSVRRTNKSKLIEDKFSV